MNTFLRQSTASQARVIGPFVDDTDFKTAETGLTILNTDIKIRANGSSFSNKNSEPVTPRILLWPYLGMRSQKMVEHVEKGQDMLLVVARLAGADVIDDHVADFFPAMFLVS